MISNDQSSMENKSGDKSTDTSEDNGKKSKKKFVPIKSRYMQSAAGRATPSAGRSSFYTPATGSKSSQSSQRAKSIEKLNHEDTFTSCDDPSTPKPTSKPSTPKPASKPLKVNKSPRVTASPKISARPETPTSKKRPQSPKVTTKPPKSAPLCDRKVGPGTPKLGRKVLQNSQRSNVSSDITPPHNSGTLQEVTQTQLNVLQNQKLQALYLLSRMEDTRDKMSEEASAQLYQMWKVQENLRSENAELKKRVCLKLYITETADMVEILLPLCTELGASLPTFEKHFRSMAQMLDSTRHYVHTLQIASLTPDNIEELEMALRKSVHLLQEVYHMAAHDKENLKSHSMDLVKLCSTINTATLHFTKATGYIQTIFSDLKQQTYLTAIKESLSGTVNQSSFI